MAQSLDTYSVCVQWRRSPFQFRSLQRVDLACEKDSGSDCVRADNRIVGKPTAAGCLDIDETRSLGAIFFGILFSGGVPRFRAEYIIECYHWHNFCDSVSPVHRLTCTTKTYCYAEVNFPHLRPPTFSEHFTCRVSEKYHPYDFHLVHAKCWQKLDTSANIPRSLVDGVCSPSSR